MARQVQYRHPKRKPAGIPHIFGGNRVACRGKTQASRRKSLARNVKVAHCGKLPFGVFPQPLRPLMMENSPSGFFHNRCTFIFLYITKGGREKGLMENSPSGFFHSPQGLRPSVASRHSPLSAGKGVNEAAMNMSSSICYSYDRLSALLLGL